VTNAYQVLGDDRLRRLYNSSNSMAANSSNPITRTHSGRRTKAHSTTSSNPFGDYAGGDEEDPYWYVTSLFFYYLSVSYDRILGRLRNKMKN